jgi:uncharacterized Ntn-hydrolase superfamily protein
LLAAAPRLAAAANSAPPVATFSIVGFDSATGDLGVAVASRFLAVGHVVPWARAGVGAIATQALGNTTYGPRGLVLLSDGMAPQQVIAVLTADDADAARRQVGVVDAQGRAATFTGNGCQAWAGGVDGFGYAAQGNILAGEEVVAAMGRAFEAARGRLAERLLAALAAGDAAGGDTRGKQSAALLVVRDKGGYAGFNDRYIDLRVDDHASPIEELSRIYGVWRLQNLLVEAFAHYQKAEWREAIALAEEAAAARPDDGGTLYNLACFCARGGRPTEALAHLARALELDPSLRALAAGDSDFVSVRKETRWKEIVKE